MKNSLLRCFTPQWEEKEEYKRYITSYAAGEGAFLMSFLIMQQREHQMETGTKGFKANRIQLNWNSLTQTAMHIKSLLMAGKRSTEGYKMPVQPMKFRDQ